MLFADANYANQAQRVFETDSSKGEKKPKNSFLQLDANKSEGEPFLAGEELLLFRLEAIHNDKKSEETGTFV